MHPKWSSITAFRLRHKLMKIDWELVIAVAVLMFLVVLALSVFAIGVARAGGCLSIDVPSQAVIHQPDGDTFHVFSLQPGGVVKIRVQGVNTPERKEPGWAEAKEFTRTWLAKGSFKLATCGHPTLDRIMGSVERDGRTLAQDIIAAGLGK